MRRLRPPPVGVLRRAGVIEPRIGAALLGSLPRLVGRGGSLGFLSHLSARALGAKPAVIDRRGTVTWHEIDERANRLARVLLGRGARPGDTVATLLRNGREQVEAILATQKLGMAVAPLNTWAKAGELTSILGGADPALLIHDERHPVDAGDLPRLVVSDGRRSAAEGGYEASLADVSGAPLPPATLHRGHPRVLIHTSGTTGRPKGARRGAGRSEMGAFLDYLSVVPLRRRDIIVCPAPLFHSFGMLTVTLWAILGATLVLPDRFDPEGTLELVERHGGTVVAAVPVMLHRISALPEERRRRDLSSVRVVIASGAVIPPALRERIADVFGSALYDMYGSTEAGLVAIATPEDVAGRPTSVGRPIPGVEVLVVDEDGTPLPAGEVGRIVVDSTGTFEGYTGDDRPDHVAGLLSTGDAGHFDDDGYLFVEGRADDMIIVGGENVYPAEIEEAILRVPGVREAAVAGASDPEFGQVVVAFVAGDADAERITATCREALASFKVPRRIERVDELPRTATGKVLVRDLVAGLEKE
jgi:fatty-acyl-CoA synthase